MNAVAKFDLPSFRRRKTPVFAFGKNRYYKNIIVNVKSKRN